MYACYVITDDRPTMSELASFPGKKRTICIPDEINLEYIHKFVRTIFRKADKYYIWHYFFESRPRNKDLVWEILIVWLRGRQIIVHGQPMIPHFPVEWYWLCYSLQYSNHSLAEEIKEVLLT